MQLNPNQNAAALLQFVFLATEAVMPAMMRVLNRAQLSLTHFHFLWHIASECERSEGMTMTDVARWRSFSTAASTGSMERLEKLGFARRQHSEDDRRKVRACITPKGRTLLAEVQNAGQETLTQEIGERLERYKLPPALFAIFSPSATK